jgi:cytochrome b
MEKIRVWDLPVRVFHWTLAVLVVISVVSAQIGGNAMVWHFRCGYAVLTLILFRLTWGIAGTRYARFSSFLYRPSEIVGYVRGHGNHAPGHNPLGGLSVVALLAVFLMQASLGLFSNDDIANDGPLVRLVSKELSDRITWFHTEVNIYAVYALVALHVAAIAWYRVRRKQDLVTPMITGDAPAADDAPAGNDSWMTRGLALALLLACAAVVYAIVT